MRLALATEFLEPETAASCHADKGYVTVTVYVVNGGIPPNSSYGVVMEEFLVLSPDVDNAESARLRRPVRKVPRTGVGEDDFTFKRFESVTGIQLVFRLVLALNVIVKFACKTGCFSAENCSQRWKDRAFADQSDARRDGQAAETLVR